MAASPVHASAPVTPPEGVEYGFDARRDCQSRYILVDSCEQPVADGAAGEWTKQTLKVQPVYQVDELLPWAHRRDPEAVSHDAALEQTPVPAQQYTSFLRGDPCQLGVSRIVLEQGVKTEQSQIASEPPQVCVGNEA
jgi:hypothetical protein